MGGAFGGMGGAPMPPSPVGGQPGPAPTPGAKGNGGQQPQYGGIAAGPARY